MKHRSRRQKLLAIVPRKIRHSAEFRAYLDSRPSGMPRLEWLVEWLRANNLYQFNESAPTQTPRKYKRREHRASDKFLASFEWRQLRMRVLKARGARCECCGATPADGVTVINVDHIKPRRDYPGLALNESNLQVLCHVCNHGKGNWDQTDWRQDMVDDGDYDIALDTLRRMRVSGEPS